MRDWGRLPLLLLLGCALGAGPAALRGEAGEGGRITGRVDKPAHVDRIYAINRETDRKFQGKMDAESGRFMVNRLPFDASYECIIDQRGGARLEGVNLKLPSPDNEQEQLLTAADVATIKTKVRGLNKFEDVVEILAVTGNAQHAAVLLNKLRIRPFVNSRPGEVVWRAELWHFERPKETETWVKTQDELFGVLYRERIPKSDYDKKSITFDAALGGLSVSAKQPAVELGVVRLPPGRPGIRLRPAKSEGPEPAGR